MKRFLIIYCTFLIVSQLLSVWIKPMLYINLTESQAKGIYQRIPYNGQLKRGELVLLAVPNPARPYVYGRNWLPKGCCLLKNVAGLPGDRVYITGKAIYINQRYRGPIYQCDSQGLPLPKLRRGRLTIPTGYFLPLTTRIHNSFDGRYFGAVSNGLIIGKAKPFITF